MSMAANVPHPILPRALAAAGVFLIAVNSLYTQQTAVPNLSGHQSEAEVKISPFPQQIGGQGDTTSTEASKTIPAQYQTGISGRWQTRLGIPLLGDRLYVSFPFVYELPIEFSLREVELQPAIAWGYLLRYEDRLEHLPDGFTDYYEGIFYGMFEVHRQWRIWQGMLGGSLHTGLGLGYSVEEYYRYYDVIQERERSGDLAWIASAGIQLEAKIIPELPTMVSDVRLYHTPGYGTSYVLSCGIRGKLLQIVGAWGLIIATYLLLQG
jgi:hypothetical protein